MMYNTERNIKIFWGVFIIFAGLYMYIMEKYDKNRIKGFYNHFNETNINDIIIKVNNNIARGKEIIFDNKNVIFYPETSHINNNNVFSSIAEKGDRVIKPAYSDTLILIKKNGEILKYTFKKPDEDK